MQDASQRTHAEARGLHQAARRGVGGGSVPFPHGEAIRRAFGQHAPEGLRAHLGGGATRAASAMGAKAYVWNGRAAFAGSPDLHTAAHEAAHIVQQSHGITLPHGIGTPGDRHERLADQVADAVSRGGSAEPLLTSALGPAGGATAAPAGLQMMNNISAHTSTTKPTPWKEIEDALDLDDGIYDISDEVAKKSKRFKSMVEEFGDSCERAESATATLDGIRPGGSAARKSDSMQTPFGALGTFEALVTGTKTPKGEDFEGGHLIADELLGKDSYVQYNFAPQRNSLNAPKYRKIEELAMEGTVAKTLAVKATAKTRPAWTMKADLGYPAATYSVATTDVIARLGIDPTAIQKSPLPATIDLTTRVPDHWHTTIDSNDPDFVFADTTTVKKDQAAFDGFLPSETDVDGQRANMTQYMSPTSFWSMDSMFQSPFGKPTVYGTGMFDQRRSTYSWTGTQTVPRGQTGKNPYTFTLPKPNAFVLPTFTKAHSFSEIPDMTASDAQMDTDTLKLATTMVTENPTMDFNADIAHNAFKAMFNARKSKAAKSAPKKKKGGTTTTKTTTTPPPLVEIDEVEKIVKKRKKMSREEEEEFNRTVLFLHTVKSNFSSSSGAFFQ